MGLLKIISDAFCPHKNQNLRFLNVGTVGVPASSTDETRYFYECIKCGAEIRKERPIDCFGCKHLWYNSSGAAECDRGDDGKSCIWNGRKYWEYYTDLK